MTAPRVVSSPPLRSPRSTDVLDTPRLRTDNLPMPTDVELQLPGLTVRGLAWGPEDGPPVLALHGWLDNAASFSGLAPLLDSMRVVAIDLPGHGLSDHRSANAAYSFIDWVPDVIAVADALGWQQFGLLGHSMGAGISCLLAGAFPDRVRRLALVEGFGPLSEEPAGAPARLARHVFQRRLAAEPRVMKDRDEAVERVLRATWGLARGSAELLVARSTREVDGGVAWRWDARIRQSSAIRLSEDQVVAFLAAIACPVLVVRASDGFPFDEKYLATRVPAVRDLTVCDVEGGHHVHLDRPERVVEAVRAHLA